jgi:hypothetical protein
MSNGRRIAHRLAQGDHGFHVQALGPQGRIEFKPIEYCIRAWFIQSIPRGQQQLGSQEFSPMLEHRPDKIVKKT